MTESQICFPSRDGLFTLCNFVVRKDGTKIESKLGKYLRIPRLRKRKQKTAEAVSEVKTVSNA